MPQRGLGCSVSLTGESASTCGRGTGLDESDSMRATTGTAPNRAIVPRAESENRPTASNFALSASRLIDAILPEISIPSQVYMFVNFFVKRCLGLITFGNYAPRCRQALGKNVPLVARLVTRLVTRLVIRLVTNRSQSPTSYNSKDPSNRIGWRDPVT